MDQFDLNLSSIPKERIEQFKDEIQEHLNDAPFFITLGDGLYSRGQLFDAITCYKRAIAINEKDPIPLNNLGNVYRAMGWLADAETCYRKALELFPDSAEILNNVGVSCQSLNKTADAVKYFEKAIKANRNFHPPFYNLGLIFAKAHKTFESIACHERVLEIQPDHFEAHLSLGSLYGKVNDPDRSLEHYARAKEINPEHPSAIHMLNALKGDTTSSPPRRYVEDLFDSYATQFDAHLTGKLQYNAPQLLSQMIKKHKTQTALFQKVLDLGCGTGLSAVELKGDAKEIYGLDLSKKMLEEARKKNLYVKTIHGDALEYLRQTDEKFDLIVAADVFVYMGNLDEVFQLMRKRLLPGGMVAFSTEICEGESYKLRESGRYAHSKTYIKKLLGEDLKLVEEHRVPLRVDDAKTLEGDLYLATFTTK